MVVSLGVRCDDQTTATPSRLVPLGQESHVSADGCDEAALCEYESPQSAVEASRRITNRCCAGSPPASSPHRAGTSN